MCESGRCFQVGESAVQEINMTVGERVGAVGGYWVGRCGSHWGGDEFSDPRKREHLVCEELRELS